jgi:Flp pilus assembly CpaE family ATPase
VDESREISPDQACALLDVLVQTADAVVVDLPRPPSPTVRAMVSRCDVLFLVLEPEAACVDAAGATVELVRACGVTGDAMKAIVVQRTPDDEGVDLGPIRRRLGLPVAGIVPYMPCSAGETNAATCLVDIAAWLANE